MTAVNSLLAPNLAAETFPSSTSRKLLQYYNNRNCDYYGNCSYYSGGRIAGIVVGCVCFALAIFFALLACTIRRRRLARFQANNAYPAGTYPAAPGYNQSYPQANQYPQADQAYPQAGQYPQANTYPNQAYPQNTEGYNPAAYNPGGAYPNTAAGTPANGYNGVQMSALPHEKPAY